MSLSSKFGTLAIAGAFAAACATSAVADSQTQNVTGFAPDPLIVLSNGADYTKLDVLGMVNISANVTYDAGNTGRVKSWKVTPVIVKGVGAAVGIPGLSAYAESKTYPLTQRPKAFDKNVVMNIPATKLNKAAVNMCNWRADLLRGQGKSDAQIFSVDQETSFKVTVELDVDASGVGSNLPLMVSQVPLSVKVICQKSGPMRSSLKVSGAQMTLQEVAAKNGACMVKLSTVILASEPGATIKFRYVHSSGKKSKVFSAKTGASKTAHVTHQWEIPNKSGPEVGWMFMVGAGPSFQSNSAGYTMQCKDVGGASGFAPAAPAKPGTQK